MACIIIQPTSESLDNHQPTKFSSTTLIKYITFYDQLKKNKATDQAHD